MRPNVCPLCGCQEKPEVRLLAPRKRDALQTRNFARCTRCGHVDLPTNFLAGSPSIQCNATWRPARLAEEE